MKLDMPDIAGVSRNTMESRPFTSGGLLLAVRECKCPYLVRFILACGYGRWGRQADGPTAILSPAGTSGPARGDAHNRIHVNPPWAFPGPSQQASIIGSARDPAITEQGLVLGQHQALLRGTMGKIVPAARAVSPPRRAPPWWFGSSDEPVDISVPVRYFT